MTRVKLTRNRIAWWLAALLLIPAIALTYRLTRPPELVWWTSPPISQTRLHLRILVPVGWAVEDKSGETLMPEMKQAHYQFHPTDDRPWLVRRLNPVRTEDVE